LSHSASPVLCCTFWSWGLENYLHGVGFERPSSCSLPSE
jgi:hypothetical protein